MPTFLNERTAPRKPCLQSIPNRANEGAMRRALPLLLSLVLPVAAAAAPTALGFFDGSGAFRDDGQGSSAPPCYAIGAPAATLGRPQAKPSAPAGYRPTPGTAEERREGTECVSAVSSRLLPCRYRTNNTLEFKKQH